MTSRASGQQVLLDLRLMGMTEDKSQATFQVPGTATTAVIKAKDETLKEWQDKPLGSIVQIRIPMYLAEGMKLYNFGGGVTRSQKNG